MQSHKEHKVKSVAFILSIITSTCSSQLLANDDADWLVLARAFSPHKGLHSAPVPIKLRAVASEPRWMFTAGKLRTQLRISSRSAAIEQHLTVLAHMANLETMMWTINDVGLNGLSDSALAYLKADTNGGIQDLRNTVQSIAARFEATQPSEFELIQLEQQQSLTESLGSALLSGFLDRLRRKYVEEEILKSLGRIYDTARTNSWPEIKQQLSRMARIGSQEPVVEVSLSWSTQLAPRLQTNIDFTNISGTPQRDLVIVIQQNVAKGAAVGYYIDEFEDGQTFAIEWSHSQLQVAPTDKRQPTPLRLFLCNRKGILVDAQLSQRPGTRADVKTLQSASQGVERIILDGIDMIEQDDATSPARLAMKHLATFETLINRQLNHVEKPLARKLAKSRSSDVRERYRNLIIDLQQQGLFPDVCREKETAALVKLANQFDGALKKISDDSPPNSDAADAVELADKTVRALYGKLISRAAEVSQ